MPDIEPTKYAKQAEFSRKTIRSEVIRYLVGRICTTDDVNDLVVKEALDSQKSNFEYLNKEFISLLQMNSEFTCNPTISSTFNQTISTMSESNLDYNSTAIEIDPNLDLHNDHLYEFNQLEDIFNFCNPRNTIQSVGGLGISLSGGKLSITDEQCKDHKENDYSLINQLIRVKKLYPAHPASECGLIDENDFILDVNDHCFVGLTYIEAFNILHSVQDEVNLRILKFNQCPLQKYLLIKDESSMFENLSSSFREENVFESTRISVLDEESNKRIRNVLLVKKDGSLGFTLSKIENGSFYVKQITKPPATEEKIYPGDRILSVNGTSLDGLDLNDAIKFLRSLPDLCEFKLEQQSNDLSTIHTETTDSLNYQSETEDDSRSKKKQLRHEVKIMLNSRNKDSLHNRLKRKELKTTNRTTLESESSLEGRQIDSGLDSRLECSSDSGLLDGQDSKSKESKLKNNKYDKENFDIFKVTNQPINESAFLRQSSVTAFGRNESNENSLSGKQNNLNKWRNQVMILSDEREEEDYNRNQLNQTVCSMRRDNQSNELNDHDEQDSGFGGDLLGRTNRANNQIDPSASQQINLIKSTAITSAINRSDDNDRDCWNRRDTIQLTDIEVKMNVNCLVNENSMYRNIENALFFYVVLDRIGWHGRIGFSLTDDEQYKDFRIVNTIQHGFSACTVKDVYPNSLAYTNGKINIGDKLLEVNNQPMINKPVQTVIKELRKLKGKLRLLFLRKVY